MIHTFSKISNFLLVVIDANGAPIFATIVPISESFNASAPVVPAGQPNLVIFCFHRYFLVKTKS